MVPLICASHAYTSAKYDITPIQFSDISFISSYRQSQNTEANILTIKLRLWFINITVGLQMSRLLDKSEKSGSMKKS